MSSLKTPPPPAENPSGVMWNVEGVEPGCPEGDPSFHHEDGWVCTDHMVLEGHRIHIAGNAYEVCAMWTDKFAQTAKLNSMGGSWKWEAARDKFLEMYPDLCKPVSKEEMDEAKEGLMKLLNELETK